LKRRNLEVDGLFGLANTFGVMSLVGNSYPGLHPGLELANALGVAALHFHTISTARWY